MYTKYVVTYNCVNTTYLVEENAKAAIERLGEKAKLSVQKNKKPYETYPYDTPYLKLNTDGLVKVGEEIVDAIRNKRYACYALPENAEYAKELLDQSNKGQMKVQDRYYAQPWV